MLLLTIGLLLGFVLLLWCLVLTVTHADSRHAGRIVATLDRETESARSRPARRLNMAGGEEKGPWS
jgi:hypothetical protein